MRSIVNEKNSTVDHIALYDIYQILSEECHNSYYFSNLDMLDEMKNKERKLALTEEQAQYLVIVIGRFMEVFRQ